MRTRFLFVVVLFAVGCKQKSAVPNRSFFDLSAFFHKEIVRLKAQNLILVKSIDNNNDSEQQTFAKTDWGKELAAFLELDVERFSHKGTYKIDSLKTGNSLTITYTALDSSLSISPIVLDFENADLKDVKAFEHVSNSLYDSYKEYNYKTGESYFIKSKQKIRFIGESTYKVSGHFSRL